MFIRAPLDEQSRLDPLALFLTWRGKQDLSRTVSAKCG
jgi:hypothetical protein